MSDFQHFKVEGPAGVNFSREPSQLNPMLWDSADNITFRHGKTFKCSGHEEGFGTAKALPEVIVPLRDDDQNFYWWAYAGAKRIKDPEAEGGYKTEDKIYRITAKGVHEDVTPTGGIDVNQITLTKPQWTGSTLNSVPFMVKAKPYSWDSSTSKFRPMEFPAHVQVKTMRTYRNFMVALNFATTDFAGDFEKGFGPWDAGEHPNALWWSHDIVGSNLNANIENEELSYWCDASSIRNSGWNFLGGTGGPIVDGKAMRDMFIIYRERSVWAMSYVGGVNVFAFKELFNDSGALGLDCVADIEGAHLVVGQSDIYIHDGVSKQSIADGIVRKEIFSSIDPDHQDKVFTVVSYDNKEVWVCVPEASTNVNGFCNIAYVYNWEEKTWSKREIPDLVSSTYSVLSLPEEDQSWKAVSEGGPLENWAPDMDKPDLADGVYIPGGTWEESTDTWATSYFQYNPSQWGLVLGSGRVNPSDGPESDWEDDNNWQDENLWDEYELPEEDEYSIYTAINQPLFNGENFEASVEKKWMDMGDRTDSSFINKIYPLVRGGPVDVYMAGTGYIDEGFQWKLVGRFDPTRDSKLSCRVSGRFVHVRYVIPPESRAEIRGYWLEFAKIGRRG